MSVVLRPGGVAGRSLFRKSGDWLKSVLFIGIEVQHEQSHTRNARLRRLICSTKLYRAKLLCERDLCP